jgi:hypothetical protein
LGKGALEERTFRNSASVRCHTQRAVEPAPGFGQECHTALGALQFPQESGPLEGSNNLHSGDGQGLILPIPACWQKYYNTRIASTALDGTPQCQALAYPCLPLPHSTFSFPFMFGCSVQL